MSWQDVKGIDFPVLLIWSVFDWICAFCLVCWSLFMHGLAFPSVFSMIALGEWDFA